MIAIEAPAPPETVSAPTAPTGPSSGVTGQAYQYSTGGATSSVGHTVQYYFDWGDGSNSGWLAQGTTSATHAWTAAGTYTVKAKARCSSDLMESALTTGPAVTIAAAETVSTPTVPSGSSSGVVSAPASTYSSGGSTSSQGHTVQYYFDWGDGSNSGWLAQGVTSASHVWTSAGTFSVRAKARCVTHQIESAFSSARSVTVTVETVTTPSVPSGPSSGIVSVPASTYSTGGSTSSQGHTVQYYIDWGDGSNSGWLAQGVTSAAHVWTSAGTFSVRAKARCVTHQIESALSSSRSVTVAVETVATPSVPSGPASGATGSVYTFTTGGSTSNQGHTVQYYFDWDDGTNSGWLSQGTTSASHSWSTARTYNVRAKARCVTDQIESALTSAKAVAITAPVETVSAPTAPSGSATFVIGAAAATYTTGGAASRQGHTVRYSFDWGDGTNSGWLASGTTSASHAWTTAGTKTVTAMARCATHTTVSSSSSPGKSVVVTAKVTVSPTSASLQELGTQTLTANQTVTWALSGTGGGSISTTGPSTSTTYTAPAAITSGGKSNTVTATATVGDTTNKASATISLLPPTMAVSTSFPSTATIGTAYRFITWVNTSSGWSDPNKYGYIMISSSSSASASNGCILQYAPLTHTVWLANNSGAYTSSGVIGSSTVLSNSQCSVSLQNAYWGLTGTLASFDVPVTFLSGFGTGTKYVYGDVWDNGNDLWWPPQGSLTLQ